MYNTCNVQGQQGAALKSAEAGKASDLIYISKTFWFPSAPAFSFIPSFHFFFLLQSSLLFLTFCVTHFLSTHCSFSISYSKQKPFFLLAKHQTSLRTILCIQPSLSALHLLHYSIHHSRANQTRFFRLKAKLHPINPIKRNSNMRASSILSIWAIWVIASVLAETPQSLPPPACHTNRCLRAFERRSQQPEASSYCSRFLNTVIEPVVVTEVAKTTTTFTFANATITQAEATTTVTE